MGVPLIRWLCLGTLVGGVCATQTSVLATNDVMKPKIKLSLKTISVAKKRIEISKLGVALERRVAHARTCILHALTFVQKLSPKQRKQVKVALKPFCGQVSYKMSLTLNRYGRVTTIVDRKATAKSAKKTKTTKKASMSLLRSCLVWSFRGRRLFPPNGNQPLSIRVVFTYSHRCRRSKSP